MKLGFRGKIYLGIFFLLLVFGVVIFFVVSWITRGALLEENRRRGASIAVNLAARVAEPLLAADFLRMKNLVDETVRLSDDIYYAFVMDRDGRVLVHTFSGGFPVELKDANRLKPGEKISVRLLDTGKVKVNDYAVPVLIAGDRFGTVRVGLLRIRIEQASDRLLLSVFLATGFIVILAAFVGAMLARPVTRRIRILHDSTEQVLRGNLDVHTAPLLKKNCWQIMNCRNEACPAHGDLRHRCWYLAGTMCPYCVEGDYARKISSCQKCPVYRRCSGDEIQSLAESFDSMTLSLKTNLTELQEAQKRLREQGQLLRTILDATPDFVCLQDRDSVYLAANRAFCRLVGRSEAEIIGLTGRDLYSPRLAEKFAAEDREIIRSGKTLVKENRIRRNGELRWLHVMKIPVRNAEGRIIGLLCSSRDITEFKRVQQQLVQAQKMETVGQLTAGIAHEINTPLGIILGYAQLLLEDVQPDSQMHADLEIIERQAKICRRIVADLLAFSRHTESSTGLVDINQAVEEVVTVLEHTFGLERITIRRDYGRDLPAVRGDREKIKQVFINLLNNARDAIGQDGTITIVTRFDREEGKVRTIVADTGGGIAAGNLDRIFDPFYTTKPVDKGTGLGLSVSFGIIKEHGGTIEAESPPSRATRQAAGVEARGTAFIIRFPPAAQDRPDGSHEQSAVDGRGG